MRHFGRDHYLDTPEGLLAQHRRRSLRSVHFSIEDVEPRAKHSMPESDKDQVQVQLLEWLVDLHRKAFRGPLALRLRLSTTEKTPTHSHNIAKNLLDLFAKPRLSIKTRRRGLLYGDDKQVHALAVTCHHGEKTPMITALASPLGSLLQDLDLAMQSARQDRNDNHEWEQRQELDQALGGVKDLLRDEANFRRRLGDQTFESWLRHSRQLAQEHLLGRAAVTPSDLAMMYNVSGRGFGLDLAGTWEQMFASTPLRVTLSELPQVTGASAVWKEEIDQKLREFQTRFGWLIDPLLVPVALEVVIKPPPPSRQNGLHDLDNVLRSYLIPRVVEILRPISHFAFTLDAEAMKGDTLKLFSGGRLAEWGNRFPKPPASTRAGVTRYEAWRLPPASEGESGFVSMAIVTDLTGHDDIFGRIDDEIECWKEGLEGSPYRHRPRRRF